MSCEAHGLAAAHPYLSEEDIDKIKKLASELPEDAQAVDLGVGPGASSLALLEGAPSRVRVVGVDTDADHLHWATVAAANIGHARDYRTVRGDAFAVVASVDDDSLDALLIDLGDEDQNERALQEWKRKLKKGARAWVATRGVVRRGKKSEARA